MAMAILGVRIMVKVRNVDPTPRLGAEDNPHFPIVLSAIRLFRTMEGLLQLISCKITPDLRVSSLQMTWVMTVTVRVAEIARWMYQK